MNSQRERTLLLIKPDGVRRGLVGRILQRIEDAGLCIVTIEMRRITREFARGHYLSSDAQFLQMGTKMLASFIEAGLDARSEFGTDNPIELGRMIFDWNLDYLTSGPLVAIELDGYHAISKVRALCGATMPLAASPGTIRGDFSSVSAAVAGPMRIAVHNIVHASDSSQDPNEPARELRHWFGSGEASSSKPISKGASCET